jgi:hypothetical protein
MSILYFKHFPGGYTPDPREEGKRQGREGQGTGRGGEWDRKGRGGEGTGRKGKEEKGGEGRLIVLTPLLFADNSHTD